MNGMKKNLFQMIAFLPCMTLTVLLSAGCGGKSDRSAFRRGMEAFREKNYTSAVELLSEAAQQITGSAELYYYLGSARLQLGELDAAKKAFSFALESNVHHGESMAALGEILYNQKQYAAARNLFKAALAPENKLTTNEGRAMALNGLSLVCREDKQSDMSRFYLIQALKVAPKYAPTYYNLGCVYQDLFNLYQEALDQFMLFKALVKKDDIYFEKAGRHIMRLQEMLKQERAQKKAKFDELLKQAGNGKGQDKKAAMEYLEQAMEFQSEKRYPRASRAYQSALNADPMLFNAAWGLGISLSHQNMRADALKAFVRASELRPEYVEAYLRAAEQAFQMRRYPQAETLLNPAIARDPFNPVATELLVRIRIAQKRIEEAREYCQFYLTLLKPDDPRFSDYEKWLKSTETKK